MNLAFILPLFALAGWTVLVALLILVSRLISVRRNGVVKEDFRFGESDKVPEWVKRINRNYMNLLEMPVLFYVIGLLLAMTGQHAPAMSVLAWVYVALRVMHSLVHISYNDVLHRLALFFCSNLALVSLWVLAGVEILRG